MSPEPPDVEDESPAPETGAAVPSEVVGPRVGPGSRAKRESAMHELVAFLPDVARLLWRVSRDPRVSWHAKAVAAGAVVYVASPLDLLPDAIPVIGQLDDVWLVTKAIRHLFNTAGYGLVRELWPGTDDGFALLLVVAGIER